MTNDERPQGDAGLDESNAEVQKEETNATRDSVQYDTYSRVLSKLKKTEAMLREKQDLIAQAEERELLEKGRWEDAYNKEKERTQSLQNKLGDLEANVLEERFKSTLDRAAREEGIRPEAVDDVWLNLRENHFDKVELNDNMQFDYHQMKALLGDFRENKPHWFGQKRGSVNDMTPQGEYNNGQMTAQEYLAKASRDERMMIAMLPPQKLEEYLRSKGVTQF
mgnify:CR=1 FL=1|tara:strand:+ start:525 stop:1190 length:666 start_codon:yes stop_codon:yes gene_type:complete